ncbi:MAG: mechanosensitive ion channel family protein [Candidatus Altiarchaeales archaeon]|nr:mechanosensitive ion channel family protein [Candidatus Altiarchaeota archaeon]MBU4341298.1 mechanosensitive ion channel family protein [Candidatus Altiarchaeota archaeon]MCG2783293.1 mechanosensitive ion channel family protein [Candidatus Altiarchaeales archaeon]
MDTQIIMDNLGIVMKIVYSIIVIIAAKIAIIVMKPSIRKLDDHIGQVELSKGTHKLIKNAIRYVIYTAALVAILYIFDVKDALYGLLTGAAVLGFAIGYASQDILSNMLSGILIAVDRPFTIGDRIMAAGITGTVKDIALRTTEVVTDEEVPVLIPNSSLLKSPIHNYGRKKK